MKRLAQAARASGDAPGAPSRVSRGTIATDAWGDGPGSQVKPVSRAFQILRFLSETGAPVRAVDVARAVGMHNSTCFNILRTMVAEGILEFHTETKTYSIGIGLVKLLGSTLSDTKRISNVMPLLHGIAERFNVTATLWRRVPPDRIVLVAVAYSPSGGFRIHMGEGQRLPVYAGATGRLFAAFSGAGKDEIEAAFRKVRWGRPLSFETYWRESRLAKKSGWAVDDGNFAQGVLIIDAPVFDREGDIAYSVSTVTFRAQQDDAAIARIGKDLVATSRKITDMLY